jgi:hypothetical protein
MRVKVFGSRRLHLNNQNYRKTPETTNSITGDIIKMSRKRSAEFVDLTGDENQHSKRVYSSQPFASQPRSTQSLNPRDSWGGVEPDEDEEIIDLSQDNEEAFGWLCIGAIDAKIVGLRYYSGFATVGEVVMIRREPYVFFYWTSISFLVSRILIFTLLTTTLEKSSLC